MQMPDSEIWDGVGEGPVTEEAWPRDRKLADAAVAWTLEHYEVEALQNALRDAREEEAMSLAAWKDATALVLAGPLVTDLVDAAEIYLEETNSQEKWNNSGRAEDELRDAAKAVRDAGKEPAARKEAEEHGK